MSFLEVSGAIFGLYVVAGALVQWRSWRQRVRAARARRLREAQEQEQRRHEALRNPPPEVQTVVSAPKKKGKAKTRKDLINDDPF